MALLFLIRSRSIQFGNSHLRYYTNCLNMKKGLILGVYETERKDGVVSTPATIKYDKSVQGKLLANIALACPKLKKAETRVFWGLGDDFVGVAVVGLGKANVGYNELEAIHEGKENIREAAAAGCRALDAVDVKDIWIETLGDAEAAAEGSSLASWFFQEFKSKEKQNTLPSVSLYGEEGAEDWKVGRIKADAQNWARGLSDTPANLMTPSIFCERVSTALTPFGIEVFVRDGAWAEKMGMGSFLSVSRGSAEPPKFLEIHYDGTGKKEGADAAAPIALVGKGVTFDAGGISIKSSADMDAMRADMGGAACVVAAIKASAELGLRVRLVGLVPLTENLPSGTATKPGDLVVAMNGKSIIVDNTDAEGRLILADALCYAQKFQPRLVLDIATLTGAIRIALGGAATGVFTNSTEMWKVLERAGSITGDRVWRLPLWRYFSDQMTKSVKAADLNNVSRGKGGGSCTAAAFLKEFAGAETPWLHLDIAGVMGMSSDGAAFNYLAPGMTGRPTRTLVQLLQLQQS